MQRTRKTVRGMSCLNGLLKNGKGSVVVAQLFKKLCQKACCILAWIYCLRKEKWAQWSSSYS